MKSMRAEVTTIPFHTAEADGDEMCNRGATSMKISPFTFVGHVGQAPLFPSEGRDTELDMRQQMGL